MELGVGAEDESRWLTKVQGGRREEKGEEKRFFLSPLDYLLFFSHPLSHLFLPSISLQTPPAPSGLLPSHPISLQALIPLILALSLRTTP